MPTASWAAQKPSEGRMDQSRYLPRVSKAAPSPWAAMLGRDGSQLHRDFRRGEVSVMLPSGNVSCLKHSPLEVLSQTLHPLSASKPAEGQV